MAKYQYEFGKTYLSESTPITVSRIPSGTYKISVKKDDAVGEYTFSTAPGTQKVSIMAINSIPPFDFSNLEVSYSRTGSSGEYTHTWTVSGVGIPEDYSSYKVSVEIGNSAGDSFVIGQTPENSNGGTTITAAGEIYCSFMIIGSSASYSDYVEIYEIKVYDSSDALVQTFPSAPKGDWDVSGLTMTGDRGLANTVVSGITGSTPVCTKIRFMTTLEDPYYGTEYVDREVSNNNPNGNYNIGQGFISDFEGGPKIVLLDANGDTIASTTTFSLTLTGYPEIE